MAETFHNTNAPQLDLIERLEKRQNGGKIVVELWCAPDLPTDEDSAVLMREQAKALREMADGLDLFSRLEVPKNG
jgi:hypothetical protein